jgi:hypothetical protein
MKLAVTPVTAASAVTHQLFLSDKDRSWRAISAPGNPLIRGRSFQLSAEKIQPAQDHLTLTGTFHAAGEEPPFGAWSGRISADAEQNWFVFDLKLRTDKDIQLQMLDGFEPEITLDLGPLPPYERGDHVWFITQVANPTKWNDDACGNDFPATYFFDPYLNAEIMMFFDMSAMRWMSRKNIARFFNYRCGFRRRYQGDAAGDLGLYATGASGNVLPAGAWRFRYFLTAAHRKALMDEHEAVAMLVERCLPLLPPISPWPDRATSWQDFSERCARELMSDGLCWRKGDDGHEFLLNYVNGHSPAWQKALVARGRIFDMIKPCFDAALWLAHPLAVLQKLNPTTTSSALYGRCCRMIDHLVNSGKSPLAAPEGDTTTGTWQHLYITEELFQLALWREDGSLMEKAQAEVESAIIPLAHNMSYLLPLSFNQRTLDRVGAGDNHAALGCYGSFMLDLHEHTGEPKYLHEAEAALKLLYRLPINTIHQEVFLLAMGAHAACRLGESAGEPLYAEIYRYLLAQTLRMMYWYRDETSEHTARVNTLGMFQACATISYPAIFENIEVLARIAPTFKRFAPSRELLRVFDHARKNNFYFFPRCFDAGTERPALQYVPYEDLPILEGLPPASVGQENYGSGWVFRAALLWETFARCDNREIMALNLDAFAERRHATAANKSLSFYLFNPTPSRQTSKVAFPFSATGAHISAGSSMENLSLLCRGNCTEVSLEPGEIRCLRITDGG